MSLFADGQSEPVAPSQNDEDATRRLAGEFLRSVRKAMKRGVMSAEPEVELAEREEASRAAQHSKRSHAQMAGPAGIGRDASVSDDEDDEGVDDEDEDDEGDVGEDDVEPPPKAVRKAKHDMRGVKTDAHAAKRDTRKRNTPGKTGARGASRSETKQPPEVATGVADDEFFTLD